MLRAVFTNLILLVSALQCARANDDLDGIVPDVLSAVPDIMDMDVAWGDLSLGQGHSGITLKPSQVHDVPEVEFVAQDETDFYTLMVVDPDAPSRADPKFREWVHWVTVNIQGSDVRTGEDLFGYVGAGPPKGTGLHRYVFLLYRQPYGQIEFNEKKLGCGQDTEASRGKFSAKEFSRKYNLGDPYAVKFFKAEYDEGSDNIWNACTSDNSHSEL